MCFDLNTIISLGPAPCLWQLTPPTPLNFSLQSSCLPNQFNPLMNSSLSWDRLQLTLSLSLCPALLTPVPASSTHSSRAKFHYSGNLTQTLALMHDHEAVHYFIISQSHVWCSEDTSAVWGVFLYRTLCKVIILMLMTVGYLRFPHKDCPPGKCLVGNNANNNITLL